MTAAVSGAVSGQVVTTASPTVAATPSTSMSQPQLKPGGTRRRNGLIFGLLALVILLIAGSLGAYFLLLSPAAANPLVGHAFFTSSGQINDEAQGITDGLQVDLHNIPTPPTGKSYYLWLLGDKKLLTNNNLYVVPPPFPPGKPILLTGNLPVQNNTVHYTYRDPQYRNLISVISRVLITLEDAGRRPDAPSTDHATWKYYAQLPQEFIPDDPTKLRGLDHIRHLYYQETATGDKEVLARPGGLDIWTFRNIEKIMEWAVSARDDFNGTTGNYQLMHNQFIRILDVLDGVHNVARDVPDGTMLVDPKTTALTSLLPVEGQNLGTTRDNPPGDLAHMQLHLNELVKAPDAPSGTRQLAQQIVDTLGNLFNDKGTGWLQKVHNDARKLFDMKPEQLAQPEAQTLLEDLATYATYSYVGQLDPATNKAIPGILQAHYDIQKLAAFDLTTQVPASL